MSSTTMEVLARIAPDVVLGARVTLNSFINLHGYAVGDDCMIRTFVEIQQGATIGANATAGAGAVVVKDVPPGEIVIGVPARLLHRAASE